jgi:hypothetical protein
VTPYTLEDIDFGIYMCIHFLYNAQHGGIASQNALAAIT